MSGAEDLRSTLASAAVRQGEMTAEWHGPGGVAVAVVSQGASLRALLEQHHRANFQLWHAEDRARDPESTDAEIAEVKREIDRENQQRNDLVERMDEELLEGAGPQAAGAPMHSETPGAMLDRLSILALKVFHTREEMVRPDVSEAHRSRNGDRLAVLERQQGDLQGCLLALWDEVLGGRRRFQVYRQLKMYNDPELNPVLYRVRAPTVEKARKP